MKFSKMLVHNARSTGIKERLNVIAEDKEDDIVLETAYSGRADYIVSGDVHLLKLKEFRGIGIVTIDEMLEVICRH